MQITEKVKCSSKSVMMAGILNSAGFHWKGDIMITINCFEIQFIKESK